MELGLQVALPVRLAALSAFADAVAGALAPQVPRQPIWSYPPRVRVHADVPVRGGAVTVSGSLLFPFAPSGHLRVGSGTALRPAVMAALAARRGHNGHTAFGHERNYIGPLPADWRELLTEQVADAEASVAAVVSALADAAGVAPDELRWNAWVRHAELCRDGWVADARTAVEVLARSGIPGAVARAERPAPPEALGAPSCIAWSSGARAAPETKVYAKAPSLLRVEVSLRSRKAVTSWARAAARSGVGGELRALAEAALPRLSGAWERIELLLGAEGAAPWQLDQALAPLRALADPPRSPADRPGRPVTATGRAAARIALEALLATGQCSAAGLKSGSATLRVLIRLVADRHLVVSPERARHFALSPALEAARRAVDVR